MFSPLGPIGSVLKTLWKRFQQEGRPRNTLRVIIEGIDKQRSMANSVRVTLFLLANVNGASYCDSENG